MSMPVIEAPRCPISRDQAITNIIESIALEQTALSHIINAEGEKLQKFLERCLSPQEILKVNDSVKETLSTIAKLETILVAKLELVSCDICKREHPCTNE